MDSEVFDCKAMQVTFFSFEIVDGATIFMMFGLNPRIDRNFFDSL